MQIKILEFVADAIGKTPEEVIFERGLIRYAIYRLLSRRYMALGLDYISAEHGIYERKVFEVTDAGLEAFRRVERLSGRTLSAKTTPDTWIIERAGEALANAIAIYHYQRSRKGGDLDIAEDTLEMAMVTDEAEAALDVIRRYLYWLEEPIENFPREEEVEQALAVAGRIGYAGIWV